VTPLRVLYINPFSTQVSGPDESLLALLGKLQPLGVAAHLALPVKGPQVPRYEALGVKVHIVPFSILKRSLRPRALLGYGLQLSRGALQLRRLMQRERIDLVHTNMEVVLDGAVAARSLGLPHVMHYRGNTNDEPKRVFDALVGLWTRLSQEIFCISESTRTIFLSRGHGAKAVALYNPVDVARFAAAPRLEAVRRALGAGEGEVLVGTIGRLHPRKDTETFVRACAQVASEWPQARFCAVGGAEAPEELAYEAKLRALVSALGLGGRFVFAGARRDMPEVFKALDLFVLSSRHEGFGRVVAEAMAAGVPMVVSDEGALPELVERGLSGRVAAAADAAAFAAELRVLLGSEAERQRLVVAGQARAKAFDDQAVAQRVFETYEALRAPLRSGGRG
jgi:glycosyltransferase involved in cell wall biosynthesis